MKKLIAMLLCVVMVMGLALTVNAADTAPKTQITAPDNGHEYVIYQIFTGDVSGKVLSNIKWGKNGTGTLGQPVDAAVLTALAAVNSKTDAEKLAVIEDYANMVESNAFAKIKNQTKTVDAGYYLIVDKGPAGEGDVISTFIVKIVGDVTIATKGEAPSVEKKVKDKNDTDGTVTDWQDSADHDVDDVIDFQLTGTLPSNFAEYEQYYYVFHDTMSAGLTFDEDSVVVTIDGVEIDEEEYTLSVPGTEAVNECTFEVKFDDLTQTLKDKDGNDVNVTASSKIVVTYTATLNEDAVVGAAGNPNKVKLEYSNNPNEEKDGDKKPGTSETPEDTVIVFTYELIVNKVDQDKKPLKGATFTLQKEVPDEDAEEENATKWVDIATIEAAEVKKEGKVVSYTANFSKLDDGKYRLVETVTPDGYNTVAPIEFTITATHSNGDQPALTGLTVDPSSQFDISMESGTISTEVVNNAGSTLPETGGMGTTLFYIVGSIMVVAAGVLLVTKKRMA